MLIKIIGGVLVVVLMFGTMFGLVFLAEYSEQAKRMDNSAWWILDHENDENENGEDVWGQEMYLDYEVTKDFRKATVISLGRDGVPNTKDDWKVEKYDYNKSYIFGKYAGQRAKELASGVVDGILEKDKFKDNEQSD